MSQIPSSASIRSVILLSQKRDALRAEIDKIDATIQSIISGNPAIGEQKALSKPKGRRTAKRGKSAKMKELILDGLRRAGDGGIDVKNLAAKLGVKPVNVHVWFATTGKKNGLIRKIGRGIYRLEAAMGMQTASSTLKAPKPKLAGKSRKPRKRTKK